MPETATAANRNRSPADSAPPPCRSANAITKRRARERSDPEQRPWPLMGDRDCDQRGRDRHDPEHHAAMRGVDGLHAHRHQQRKQDGDADHRDHELRPQRARRQRAAQHDQQHQRTQPGDHRAQRGQCNRINGGNREPRRRQRAAKNQPRRQNPATDRDVRAKKSERSWCDMDNCFADQRTAITRSTWRPCARYLGAMLLHTNPRPDRNSRPSTMS